MSHRCSTAGSLPLPGDEDTRLVLVNLLCKGITTVSVGGCIRERDSRCPPQTPRCTLADARVYEVRAAEAALPSITYTAMPGLTLDDARTVARSTAARMGARWVVSIRNTATRRAVA